MQTKNVILLLLIIGLPELWSQPDGTALRKVASQISSVCIEKKRSSAAVVPLEVVGFER